MQPFQITWSAEIRKILCHRKTGELDVYVPEGGQEKKALGWIRPALSWEWLKICRKKTWVCLKIVYPYTQWLMIIIPFLNGYNWGYTPFPDIPIWIFNHLDNDYPNFRWCLIIIIIIEIQRWYRNTSNTSKDWNPNHRVHGLVLPFLVPWCAMAAMAGLRLWGEWSSGGWVGRALQGTTSCHGEGDPVAIPMGFGPENVGLIFPMIASHFS